MSKFIDARTRILTVANEGRLDLAEKLIKQLMADSNNQEITSTLYEFSKRDHFTLVKLCLKYTRYVDQVNCVPALACAIRRGNWDITDDILALKIDLNQRDSWGRTILMYSVQAQSFDVVLHLLNLGADPEVQSNSGAVALHEAVSCSNLLMADLLIRHGARLDKFDNSGTSPLHKAIARKDNNMVALLLSYGADPNLENKWGEYPLFDACNSSFEIWIMLLNHGADPKISLVDGWTPLHTLATGTPDNGDLKAEHLLILGAPINSVSRHERTPLHVSIEHGNREMVEFFIENGADIEKLTWGLRTPLILATEIHRSYDIMSLLLEANANPNVYNEMGLTPVKIAYEIEAEEKLELLLEYNAKPYDPWGNTKFFQQRPLPKGTAEIMIKHFAECPHMGIFVDEIDLNRLKRYHPVHYELYKQYSEELLRMIEVPFYKGISYIDVFRGTIPSPLPCSKEICFKEKVHEPVGHLFPLYYDDLKNRLNDEYWKGRIWRFNEIELEKIFEGILPLGAIERIAYHTVTELQ